MKSLLFSQTPLLPALKIGLQTILHRLAWPEILGQRAINGNGNGNWARRKGLLPAQPPPRHSAERHCVALVGAGPGCADLMTLRGARRLQTADIIFYDRLVDPGLLDLAPRLAERVFVGKAPGNHSWPQHKINAALVKAAQQGKRVLRLKCGDPGVFARGAEEAVALRAANLAFEIIPGVTAASACAAHIGMFMTERGVVDTLVLATATSQDLGLAPDWLQYLHRGARIAIYMGVHMVPRLSSDIQNSGFAAEIEVAIVSKLGQPDGRSFTCRPEDMADLMVAHKIENPAIIFITRPKALLCHGKPNIAHGVLENASPEEGWVHSHG